MKKALIAGGLAGLLLACLPLNSIAQKRQYIQGNVHDVKYKETTEKDFPKYKLEEQNLFGNSYHFWNYTHKNGELDFWVSRKEEEEMTFQEGKQTKIGAPSYIPTKISDKINITELIIERTSLEKLKKRAKERNSAGFSVDINDKDLKFELPQQTINGKKYLIFREMIDNSQERTDLPFYLIPKTKGTKIHFLEKAFLDKNNYEVKAVITCDEEGGIFQPILNEDENLDIYNSGQGPSGIPEQNQGSNKKTDYMKYREELENGK